jgi:Tfp pilus assembly protein FimT
MLIVVVVLGGLAMFTLPKFSGLVERNKLTAARQEVAAAIATARAAAIQKGSTATVWFSSGSLSVTVVNAGGAGTTTLVPVKSLASTYGVSLTTKSAADSAIAYDLRGFARLAATGVVRLAIGTRKDSVCLTSAGQIMPKGCSL